MIVALTGSHGTGKSRVYRALQEELPQYSFFSEGVRHQMPLLGYPSPYEFVEDHGVGAFELMNMNSWAVIDPDLNPLIKNMDVAITDRSSVDNYAYFLSLAKERDVRLQPVLGRLARHYASLIDQFVYFPIGNFPLKADDMRPAGEEYQAAVDANIHRIFEEFGIDESRIHRLGAITVQDRVAEVKSLIKV